MKTAAYPSRVADTPIGRGLIAEETLEEETVAERLEGRVVAYNKIPEHDIRNAFETPDGRWIIAQSNVRHINHSCDPNCYIADNLDLITLRKVYKGEELPIMYNRVTPERDRRTGSAWPGGDDRRSCGSFWGTPKGTGGTDG